MVWAYLVWADLFIQGLQLSSKYNKYIIISLMILKAILAAKRSLSAQILAAFCLMMVLCVTILGLHEDHTFFAPFHTSHYSVYFN